MHEPSRTLNSSLPQYTLIPLFARLHSAVIVPTSCSSCSCSCTRIPLLQSLSVFLAPLSPGVRRHPRRSRSSCRCLAVPVPAGIDSRWRSVTAPTATSVCWWSAPLLLHFNPTLLLYTSMFPIYTSIYFIIYVVTDYTTTKMSFCELQPSIWLVFRESFSTR